MEVYINRNIAIEILKMLRFVVIFVPSRLGIESMKPIFGWCKLLYVEIKKMLAAIADTFIFGGLFTHFVVSLLSFIKYNE